jgi:hypothetical protein
MKFEVGQRVAHIREGVGIVENEFGDNDENTTDVRWLTPHNTPSCVVSMCSTKDLVAVPDLVVPMPRSKEWYAEAKAFYNTVATAIKECEL